MSPLDASFLHIEDGVTHMHIGSVAIFDGPAPPFDRLREMIGSKLDLVPRYRQKVRFVPLAAGPPVWIDDPHFNLDYHLRHTAVPAPGSDEQLRKMAARVFSGNLDRARPLWEVWLVEGLSAGRFALLSKTHHALVDGISGVDIMTVLFDTSSEPMPVAPPVLMRRNRLLRAPTASTPMRSTGGWTDCMRRRPWRRPASPRRSKRISCSWDDSLNVQ